MTRHSSGIERRQVNRLRGAVNDQLRHRLAGRRRIELSPLRRHISTRHGFNRDEYVRRWGLRSDHPLNAPAYSEQRSTLAKAIGLGRKSTAQASLEVSPPAAPRPVDVDQGSQADARKKAISCCIEIC